MKFFTSTAISIVSALFAVSPIIYYYNNNKNSGSNAPDNFVGTEGTFTVLSYNVAGLPDIISQSNPRVNKN